MKCYGIIKNEKLQPDPVAVHARVINKSLALSVSLSVLRIVFIMITIVALFCACSRIDKTEKVCIWHILKVV